MKTCNACGETKELSLFYREGTSKDGRSNRCKICKNKSISEWRAANREEWNRYMREFNRTHPKSEEDKRKKRSRLLKHRYKITLAEYHVILDAQGGRCSICSKPPKDRKPLVVDHCHKTGLMRGLLCFSCNRSISLLDDAELLEKAQTYLKNAYVPLSQ